MKRLEYRYYLALIQDEIAWCKKNPDKELSKEYQQGFIKGLQQAQFVIRETKKKLVAMDKKETHARPRTIKPR